MTATESCAEHRLELGVYVLGGTGAADCADSPGRYGDGGCTRRHELSADLGPRCLLGRAARLRQHRMRRRLAGAQGVCPIVAGTTAACGRHRVVPHRTCRAIMGTRGGDSAR
jgi:hypothetical protein